MINWRVRFKNPVFLAQLFLSILVPILGYYGLTAKDLTTWQTLIDLLIDAVKNPYVVSLILVGLWNAINDPTTKGYRDSERAKRYSEPQ